ncbi:TPA: RICH domain-containing protein, partial [Streptococcus pneumoniae]
MFASKNERKVHYSIRKFSIGVASVAVASLFMGSVVHATEKEVTTQVATSSNKANKSQTEHMKAAKQVDEYIEKMLSEIQLVSEIQLDRRKHTQNVGLLTKLGAIKTEYLRGLSVSKEKSTAELPSEIKEKLTAAFEQFKKDTLKSGKKVAEAQKKAKDQKEAKQEIEALIVKHKGREIDLDRKKAKAAVTEHLKKLLNDIEKNLKKEQHTHTVELIKNLKDIEKTYLHKLDESTQKAQLQKLIAESQSKLDEAFSKFKNGLSSSSNSGSSTKPETP